MGNGEVQELAASRRKRRRRTQLRQERWPKAFASKGTSVCPRSA